MSRTSAEADVALHDRLMTARRDPDALDRKADESDLLVDLAPHLEDFIGELFGIAAEVRALQARHDELAPLYSVKRLFVQRRAVKGIKEADAAAIDGPALARELDTLIGVAIAISTPAGGSPGNCAMPSMSRAGSRTRPAHAVPLEMRSANTPPGRRWRRKGRRKHRRGLLFKVPHRLDMHHLVPVETVERDGVTMLRLPEDEWRRARRLCADRPRHRPRRRARPGELLHLVPQPGQGQLLAGA